MPKHKSKPPSPTAWIDTLDPEDVAAAYEEAAKQAMEAAGFHFSNVMDVDMFLDNADGRPREAVHVLYAEEIVRQGDAFTTPSVEQSNRMKGKVVVELESLVRMKLTSFRRKDQVHVLDMIEVGLIDATWVERLETSLGQRLQELLDDPFG